MNLEAIWEELEGEIRLEQHHGRRRILADSPADLNITVTQPGPRRGLALTITDDAMVDIADLPDSRGLEHIRRPAQSPGRTTLELRLTDADANDMFVAMAGDVARAAAAAPDDSHAVGAWVSRIRSWQRLMARNASGLSAEAQRGLYAELDVIREVAELIGIATAIDGWQGPLGGHDLQLPGGAYEVKGTASHEPQVVTITSERQLDETGTDGLHLVHLSLDVHRHAGESLPDIVTTIRTLVATTAVEHLFEERLVDAGYTDVHEPRYAPVGYTIRERNYFTVQAGFPRIIEAGLPDGVGGVRYRLVVASCAPFATTAERAYWGLRRLA